MSERIYCNRNWKFSRTFEEWMIDRSIDTYETVTLPHNVCDLPYNYFDEKDYQMVCCYQKSIPAPAQWDGMRVRMIFEAIGHDACIYVNGRLVSHHRCGYTAIDVDLSNVLNFGSENLITIRVDTRENLDQPPFGNVIDYLTYGGMYREVYFEISSKARMLEPFYRPIVLEKINTSRMTDEDIAQMVTLGIVKTTAKVSPEVYELAMHSKITVAQYLDGKLLFEQPVSHLEKNGSEIQMSLSSGPTNIRLWDIVSPTLYTITTKFRVDGIDVEEANETIGFRSAEFRTDGFYLNGRKLLLRGLNRHQSYPYVGYAMPESMQRYDAFLCKEELGLNAVRTSHYPQSQYFIDECDRQGLLVFSEIPGWQHIGGEDWKKVACDNVREMIVQYRNHPSIILWGVRINESKDDDEFYEKTNEIAHIFDDTRPTGGVRNFAKSHLFEDVYTFNDFSHTGKNPGCIPKEKVTSVNEKPYLISEYNGHIFPTKTSDCESNRTEQAIRHANVINQVSGSEGISGAFGWCMFDYNTHSDFGSGDKICYHGVMDMFRNKKTAAYVYAADGLFDTPVLEISTDMNIGEMPAGIRSGLYILSNADKVRMYRNGVLLKEYKPSDSPWKNLRHGPILIDDFIGATIYSEPGFSKGKAALVKKYLNHVAMNGSEVDKQLKWLGIRLKYLYDVDQEDLERLYQKYVGEWGGRVSEYRFDAIKNDKTVKSITKSVVNSVRIKAQPSHTLLSEGHTYDVAEVRLSACDDNGNVLPLFAESATLSVTGPIEIIGPTQLPFRGGYAGVYVKTTGEQGNASLVVSAPGCNAVKVNFDIERLGK